MANMYRTISVERGTSSAGGNYSRLPSSRYAGSVYAGAGGYGTKISSSSTYGGGYGGGYGSGSSSSSLLINTNSDILLKGNEKQTMQNLNDRLATYLDKVRSLEKSNSKIELQIKDWYSKNSSVGERDYQGYYKTIEDLKNEILNRTMVNAEILLKIDNAKLAAEDFRLKFESEQSLRIGVEKDIVGLRKLIDDINLERIDLEHQYESLQEELAYLRKSHEEDTGLLRNQITGNVTVEVDAAPSVDLAKVLADMRTQCEEVVTKIKQDAKQQFETRIEEVNVQIGDNVTELENYKTSVKEIKRHVQSLEIELQSEMSKKDALSATLDNINAQYAAQLLQMQTAIKNIEEQLIQIRSDMSRQSQEYEILLNVKLRLELEIETYRRLLEGDDVNKIIEEEKLRELSRSRKIKTIVEEVVDGKVISSQVKEIEEQLPSVKQ
ncbi:uncharacterized protein LOC100036883 [Xenopus laevis]|uniref:LOC100036883 protein n=2 Tax=Xenopus laevis TaxID=8355 RepID=A1L2L4_XENLA|nr:uncharacterized protein LOC100036883 [Xenopus laevis]AAI29589.1 LOC100036883 protein [Xenopus laevis]OCT62034.1 hypothetical protein XELAEV_18043118mg [Xenopus laevis]